jgi:hypothetical protein
MDTNRLEVILSIVDENTAAATAKARANMRNFVEEAVKAAQGASNSLDKVTIELARSFEKASGSAMSSLDRLEARAALAGKRGVDRLVAERELRIKALGDDEAAIRRVTSAYDKLITAQQKSGSEGEGHGVGSMVLRRGFLAVKDFGEGRIQGTMAEAADILFGQGGSGGVVQKFIPEIAELTGLSSSAVIAVGSLTAAFLGLGFAGVESARHLAETGEQIKNFSVRSGIDQTRVQAFQFAAKAAGQDPNIVETLSRQLSRAADDSSPEGLKKRDYLQNKLGVNLFDDIGNLKPTEQIFLDIADGINKLPPGLERSAAMVKIFEERGAEALPVFEKLRESLNKSDEIGNTFTEADLKMFEEWKRQIILMDEEWTRFKAEVMKPLAVAATVTLKVVNQALGAGGEIPAGGRHSALELNPIIPALSAMGLFDVPPDYHPKPPGVPAGLSPHDIALEQRKAADALIEQRRRSDPESKRRELERQMAEIGAPILGRTPIDKAKEYYALQDQLKQLKGSKDGNKDLEAAAKERQQLLAESASIAESSQFGALSAGLNSQRELSTSQDIDRLMDLAKRKAVADEQKFIADHADANGRNSAQFLDAANANLPQRIENEQAKVLAKISEQDARYFRARNEADGKAWDEAWHRRLNGELQLQQDEINIRQQTQTKQFDINGSAIDRRREIALQGLDGANAQTLQQKIALEDQKFAIEQTYAQKSLDNQLAKIQNEEALKIAAIQGKDASSDVKDSAIAAVQSEYQQQIDAARAAAGDREIIDAQKTQQAKEKLQIESNKHVYESLKQDAAGLFDQLVFHTKSWGDFAKDLFKSTILTPVKEIFSSQVAALFTGALTGQNVSFGEVGNGQGAFGRLGSIFGRAGLGQPRFGANQPLTKLDLPGHLGDVGLVQGAVPVVIQNAPQLAQAHAEQAKQAGGGFSFGSLAAGIGLAGLFSGSAAASSAPGSHSSTYSFPDGIIDGTSSPGAFSSLAKLVGGPGGTSGFAGPVSGYGVSSSFPGGILGRLGGLFGKIPGFGRGTGTGEIDPESGAPLGRGIPGHPDNSSGEVSAFGSHGGAVGGALAAIGLPVAIDGIRRGGLLGTLEAAGGGAAVGFRFGGPLGAAIGAAIGGGIAGIRSLLGKGDRQHAKDLVKQVYGMSINDATADQIVQIAKQSYGNQIDVAVRSSQVRDLLKLYAQATGQKSAEDQFVQSQVHSASFVESGGRLQQQAIYDNGNAYSYSSPLSVYGGVQTSPLSTFAPNQGVFNGNLQINLNGQSASDALAGQVVRVATPSFVQGQALSASGSSIGRTAQQNMTLSPSALTR